MVMAGMGGEHDKHDADSNACTRRRVWFKQGYGYRRFVVACYRYDRKSGLSCTGGERLRSPSVHSGHFCGLLPGDS